MTDKTHGFFLNIEIKNSAQKNYDNKILDKQSKHLLPVIDEHEQLTVTMATKEDISDM